MPHGNNDRGGAGAKSPIVDTVLVGYFGGELVLLGTNDRGKDCVNFPVVGTALIGYLWGELVPHGTNDRGGRCRIPYCEQRLDRVYFRRAVVTWYQ